MDESFNLRLEDESIPEMSRLLWECCSLIYKNEPPTAIDEKLAWLPKSSQLTSLAHQTQLESASSEEEDDAAAMV